MSHFVDNLTAEQLVTSTTERKVPNIQATVSGVTALTSASNSLQIYTSGASGQTTQLPNATTITTGYQYWIFNAATQSINVSDGGANVLATLTTGQSVLCYLETNSTAAGVWVISIGSNLPVSVDYIPVSNFTQFTAAVSALNALNGGEIRITGPIVLTSNLTLNMSNITIEGDIGSTSPLNFNGFTITISGSGAVFRHVRFLGTNGSVGSVTNNIFNLDPVTTPIWIFFEGCMFKNIYGSVATTITYGFTIPSSSVTAGAVYTVNNGLSTYTYTVTTTIAPGTTLTTTGDGTPPATGTLTKVSGTGPATIAYTGTAAPIGSGIAFDFRNATTNSLECVFSNCDMDANWVAYPGGFGTGLTIWFSQTAGFDYHVKSISNLESIQGRDRYIICPPNGLAVANNQIFFESDGSGRHFGPLPGIGNASQQIELLPLHKIDARSMLVDVPNNATMSLEPNFSGLYQVGEGLVRLTATSSATSVTLPAVPYAGSGFQLNFYKLGSNNATLVANTGQTINGGSSYILTGTNTYLTLNYDNATDNWIVYGSSAIWQRVQYLTGTTVLTGSVNTIVNASGPSTITLPAASSLVTTVGGILFAQSFSITNISSNAVTVAAAGTDTINGAASVSLNIRYSSYTFQPYYTGTTYAWVIT